MRPSISGKIFQIDDALLTSQDNTTKRLRALTDYQCALLLAQTEYLTWLKRYLNLQRSFDEQLAIVADTSEELMNSLDLCAAIEGCLETSQTIININAELVTISQQITDNTQSITNIETTINNTTVNTYPSPPTPSSDAACQASHYVAARFINVCIDTYNDAATITEQEFIEAFLGFGGWNASILVQLWDYFTVGSYPTFASDANSAIDTLAQSLYCENLSIAAWRAAIPSLSIATSVKNAMIIAIDATDSGLVAQWVAVAQLTETGNSCTACGLTLGFARSAINNALCGTLTGADTYASAFTGEGSQQHRIRLVVLNGSTPATATVNFMFTTGSDAKLVRLNTLAGSSPVYTVIGQGTLLRNQDIVWTLNATYSNSGAQVIEVTNQTAFSGVKIWIT